MYAKDLNEPNYQFLNKKREDVGIKCLKDPKAFIEYSGHMEHAYNNVIDYNPNRSNSMQFNLEFYSGYVSLFFIKQSIYKFSISYLFNEGKLFPSH